MNKFKYDKYYPFKDDKNKKIRDQQRVAIEFVLSNIGNKRAICCEIATGGGKSAIAITVAKYLKDNPISDNCEKGAYIVTTQRILQEQYFNDFNDIANIWSKSNYTCSNPELRGASCQHGMILNQILDDSPCSKNCPYLTDKQKFITSDISLTNISFLLNAISYSKDLKRRQLLVIDECHNLEQSIVDFVSSKFTKEFYETELINKKSKDKFPKNIATMQELHCWITSDYKDKLNSRISAVKDDILTLDKKSRQMKIALKTHEELDRHLCQVNRFVDNFNDEWVLTPGSDFYEIKPIYASKFAHQFLYRICDKILFMSATILDHKTFCRNVGISHDDSCFISLGSPFKVENRAVCIIPTGSMNYANIKTTLPIMSKKIQEILKQNKGNKGIIHAHTYQNAKYFKDNDKTGRLLIHDSRNRMEILKEHIESPRDTVIISPSFTEGIDLKGDLSRFQIVCKIPFPFLGDNYIKTKMEKCQGWYEWQTAKTLIQALGRSIRDENDYAISYILDSSWDYFYKKNKNMFPPWFREAIIV
jgi:Rad3-related DNA helicase